MSGHEIAVNPAASALDQITLPYQRLTAPEPDSSAWATPL